MSQNTRELHVHLGVDNLLEDLFERLYSQGILNNQNTSVSFIDADTYRLTLRSIVDAAEASLFRFEEKSDSRNLLLSRPRMIFSGSPLNCSTGYLKFFYKLEQIQNIFSGRKIIFHVFLTDHISYLFRHEKYVEANTGVARKASWVNLIESIKDRITYGNQLAIWNSEEPDQFFRKFSSLVLQVAPEVTPELQRELNSVFEERTPPVDLAVFAKKYGLDQDHFDYLYEDEMVALKMN